MKLEFNKAITSVNISAGSPNDVRHMVRKHNFDYLREKVGNFDRDDITVALLCLDADIEKLWAETSRTHVDYFTEGLSALAKLAETLRTHAVGELEKARAVSGA
jgi:hypothetical protein